MYHHFIILAKEHYWLGPPYIDGKRYTIKFNKLDKSDDSDDSDGYLEIAGEKI